MKKPISLIILSAVLFLAFTACDTKESSSQSEPQAEITSVTESQTKPPESSLTESIASDSADNAVGGYDELSRKYYEHGYDIYCCDVILGNEAVEEWVNNIFLKKSQKDMSSTPTLYQAVKELGISKEQLLKYNNDMEAQNAASQMIPDFLIDALYLEDVNEINKIFTGEYGFYSNGTVYSFNDLALMGIDGIKEKGFDKAELKSYFEKMQRIILEDYYLNSYEKFSLDYGDLFNGVYEYTG
ncbi:MAG: hypothetical protein WC900_05100 [Oscillospiraceae bacterium]